jgi:hypothetical protein
VSAVVTGPASRGSRELRLLWPRFLGRGNDFAQLGGTVEWTAVEDYPASPELIGTFTSGGVGQVFDANSFDAAVFAEFAEDFPAGSVDPITVSLEAEGASPLGVCAGSQPQSFCIEHGEILSSAPAPPIGRNLPALLAVCIVLLGAKLLKRGQNRRRLGAGLT